MEIRLDYTEERDLSDILIECNYIQCNKRFWQSMNYLGLTEPLSRILRPLVVKNVVVENNVLILESKPQIRTIFNLKTMKPNKASFDYLIHVFQFIKYEDNYIYLGVANRSFSTFQSDKSLETLDSPVHLSFTDTKFNGLVCLNHEDDGRIFNNREELVDFLLKQWWGMYHENAMYYHAPQENSLRESVNGWNTLCNEVKHRIGSVYLPKNSELIRKKYNGNQT
jgi:hypothetical protein